MVKRSPESELLKVKTYVPIFAIYIGENPASEQLKQGLLKQILHL